MDTNTRKLHDLGQRIWLDNITREMLNNGSLAPYIAELSVTGLTSNPTIFEHAIGSGDIYDDAIQELAAEGLPCEDIFFELAVQDLTQAADLFRPAFDASSGSDGWVSLEVSPLLANDTGGTIQAAARLHYLAAAHAYLRGIQRRIKGGLDPKVKSVASLTRAEATMQIAGRLREWVNFVESGRLARVTCANPMALPAE